MKEKAETLYFELFNHLKHVIDRATEGRATSAEVESIPEVARVLIEVLILQSQM